jgi:hypothetical protein
VDNILLWLGLLDFFSWLIMLNVFYIALEKECSKKFKELGKPSLFSWIKHPESGLIVYSFIHKREYANLNSRKINTMGNILLILLYMVPSFFLLLFLPGVFFSLMKLLAIS